MIGAELFTPSGVRLRRHKRISGDLNWLFFPGGPGIGSESLESLIDVLDMPGDFWLVDLPGDGSNTTPPDVAVDFYQQWPHVLIEAVDALPNCICVGHSTGGMYLLSVPELETRILGLVLVSSAPNADWYPRYVEMTTQHPLFDVERAVEQFEQNRTNETLREVAVASAPWNFTSKGLASGRRLLERMPYNLAAVEWSDQHFDHTYVARWWPKSLPTLIVSGVADRIVDQSLWEASEYQGQHIVQSWIDDAAHFPWIENSGAVSEAFSELATLILNKMNNAYSISKSVN